MGDDNTNQKKRKPKWITSYSNMSFLDAEKRLGFKLRTLESLAEPVDKYRLEENDLNLTKEKVYDRIVEYLSVEGYPTEADTDFKEANINDLVYAIVSPILFDFTCRTGRKSVQLRREREVISTDFETGGVEEFVVMDMISVTEEKFVLIVEAKRASLGRAMRQCLLSMKDMRDNGGGEVYGFVTTGETWRMLRYNGMSFELTEKIDVLFGRMGRDKERWIKDYSALVDCMYAALNNGGIVQE